MERQLCCKSAESTVTVQVKPRTGFTGSAAPAGVGGHLERRDRYVTRHLRPQEQRNCIAAQRASLARLNVVSAVL